MVLYDIVDFVPSLFNIKKRTPRSAMQNAGSERNVISSIDIIHQTSTESQVDSEKKSQEPFSSAGLQLSSNLNRLNSNTIYTQS